MKRLCLLLTLSVCGAVAAHAQSTPPAATPPPAHQHQPAAPPLTKDQMDQVNKAYATAIKANPDLVSEQNDIKSKQKELQEAQKAYQDKLDKALVKADPTLSDIVASHPNLRPAAPKATPPPKPAKTPKPKPAPKTATSSSTNAAPVSPTPPSSGN